MKNVLLFVLLMALLAASCEKKDRCPDTFELPATLFPAKRTYHVGDTLLYVSKFHRNVNARNNEGNPIGVIDMEGVDWQPLSFLARIDTVTSASQGSYSNFITYCEYLKNDSCAYDVQSFSNGETYLSGAYSFKRDSFFLSYKLILKQPGTFVLHQGSSHFTGGTPVDYPGKCTGLRGFNIRYILNNGGENNIDILLTSPDTHWNKWVLEDAYNRYHKFGRFSFVVLP